MSSINLSGPCLQELGVCSIDRLLAWIGIAYWNLTPRCYLCLKRFTARLSDYETACGGRYSSHQPAQIDLAILNTCNYSSKNGGSRITIGTKDRSWEGQGGYMTRDLNRRELIQGLGAAAAGFYLAPGRVFAATTAPTAPVAVARCSNYGPEVVTTLATMFDQLSLLQKSEHSVIYEAGTSIFRIGFSLPTPK